MQKPVDDSITTQSFKRWCCFLLFLLCLCLQTRPAPRLQALTVEKEHDDEVGMGESDDEVGDEEDAKRNFISLFLASITRIMIVKAFFVCPTQVSQWGLQPGF